MATTETKKTAKRSAKSLRNEIRARLTQIEDTEFLRAMLVFMQSHQDVPKKLPDFVLQAVEEAERDVAEGRLCSHEEVMEETRQWLAENP